VSIFGSNLASAGDARLWNSSTEIVNGKFPLSLDNTSVTVNGKSAAVEYIQPSQVNIQAPDDTAVGPVQVVVTTPSGSSTLTVNSRSLLLGSSRQRRPTLSRSTPTIVM
jgi:uncharacterized protein (TIGR03437 family)